MPCRPAIGGKGGREGGRKERRKEGGRKEVEGGGGWREACHFINTMTTVATDTTKSKTAAIEAQLLELQLCDLGVPVGLLTQGAFCQLSVEGLQGQVGLTSPS